MNINESSTHSVDSQKKITTGEVHINQKIEEEIFHNTLDEQQPRAVGPHRFSVVGNKDSKIVDVDHVAKDALPKSECHEAHLKVEKEHTISVFRKIINFLFASEIRDVKAVADFFQKGYEALVGDAKYFTAQSIASPILTATITHEGKVVGKETAERKDVIDITLKQANAKHDELNHVYNTLTNELDKYVVDSSKHEEIKEKIKLVEVKLEKCDSTITECERRKKEGKSWLGSNDFRDLLQMDSELDKAPSLQKGVEIFTDLMKRNIPAGVNFRNHQVSSKESTINMVRLGGMTDMSNSYIHLDDLKAMADKEGLRGEKFKELNKLLKDEHDKNGVTRKAIVLQYACNQLQTPDTVKVALAERRLHLQQQFLQVVQQHVDNTGGAGNLGTILPMVHLSLLNQYTQGDDKTGWHKDEGNIMRDMNAIFSEMRDVKTKIGENTVSGAVILCDGTGPYIDEDNVIHLAEKVENGDGSPKQVILKPTFFNISVQGSTVNDFDQRKINKENMKVLVDFVEEYEGRIDGELLEKVDYKELKKNLGEMKAKLADINVRLEKGESSYDLACALQDAILESRFLRYSVNCLSAKDRTGIMCAHGALKHAMNGDPDNADAIQKENGSKLFAYGGIALKIAQECGLAAIKKVVALSLKSTAFDLPDFTFVSWQGVAKRIYEFALNGIMWVQPLARFYYFATIHK